MKPGHELDALIAKKVMGWKREQHLGLKQLVWKGPPDLFVTWRDDPLLYSTSIAAAWEVVEKIKLDGNMVNINTASNFSSVQIEKLNNGRWDLAVDSTDGDTAPHAICLAALKAVGYEPA